MGGHRPEFEVAVVGGGLAGAALARALPRMQVALIAPPPPPRSADGALDARIYAISPGNAAFLERIGAWSSIPAGRLAPVHAMRVFGDDGRSCIEFDAWRSGVPELAWIVEDAELQAALRAGLEVNTTAECERIETGAGHATLSLKGGATLDAKLVVGADGARSMVRAQAGVSTREQAYGQTAVVANFSCERPHRNVALQWFQAGPVLALLPLPGERVSMVWSVADAEAARLLALAPEALCGAVEAASHGALGTLGLVTAPRTFPLRRLRTSRMAAPRTALLGDAAHVIHPLAGQGANLGLQDARVLAEVLSGREPFRDPGEARLLRRYERSRAEAVASMDTVVHGLHGLFDADRGAALARVRNAGLNLADRLPVLKNLLIRQAMA
ncbi:MAG: FAD-dependent monooxygenase [Betaproteobacteria bacterium]